VKITVSIAAMIVPLPVWPPTHAVAAPWKRAPFEFANSVSLKPIVSVGSGGRT
jgi:hypothetical protein